MFGSSLVSLQQYMEEKLGADRWKLLLSKAGLPNDKIYKSLRFYPDHEFDHLVSESARFLNTPRDDLLRELGCAFGAYLLKTYSIMFFPSWRALDVIEKAAPKVFKSIQLVDPYTPKSNVWCERIHRDEVVVHYTSTRKLCVYILGIIDAMGLHFNEKLEITHYKCMNKGDADCEIHVKLIQSA